MDPVTLLIIAAVGYFLYAQYVNGTTTAATTTHRTAAVVTGGLAAQVSVSGGVTPGPNNSLQANFIINGVQMPIAVVPNGDAYEPTSWTDITSTLLTMRAQMAERVLGRRDTQGRHGPFQILTVEHQYFQHDRLCVREERDIVYLQGPVPAQPAPNDEFATKTPGADPWALSLTPDPVMLMRFSALTFNSHLIHFDQLYTQREEGYPERVVQGPLVAIVLAQLLSSNQVGRIARFEFRARSPLYVNQPVQFMGKPEQDRVELRAIGPSGMLAMHATAWFAQTT